MAGRVRVFCSVPVRRIVATQRHTALLTGSQMHPLPVDLYAFGAFEALGKLNIINGGNVRTGRVSHDSSITFPSTPGEPNGTDMS
jgi:hypothetical protein